MVSSPSLNVSAAPALPPVKKRRRLLTWGCGVFVVGVLGMGAWLWSLGQARLEGDLVELAPADADLVLVVRDLKRLIETFETQSEVLVDSPAFAAVSEVYRPRSTALTVEVSDSGEAPEPQPGPREHLKQAAETLREVLARMSAQGFDPREGLFDGDLVYTRRCPPDAGKIPAPGTVLAGASWDPWRDDEWALMVRISNKTAVMVIKLLQQFPSLATAAGERLGLGLAAVEGGFTLADPRLGDLFLVLRENMVALGQGEKLRQDLVARLADPPQPGFQAPVEAARALLRYRENPRFLATFALSGRFLRIAYLRANAEHDENAKAVSFANADFDAALDLDPQSRGNDLMARTVDDLRRLYVQPAMLGFLAGGVDLSADLTVADAAGESWQGLGLALCATAGLDPRKRKSHLPPDMLSDQRMRELAEPLLRLDEQEFTATRQVPGATFTFVAAQLDPDTLLSYLKATDGDIGLQLLMQDARANFNAQLATFWGFPEVMLPFRPHPDRRTPPLRGFLLGLSDRGRLNDQLQDELIAMFKRQINPDTQENRELIEQIESGKLLKQETLPKPHFLVDLRDNAAAQTITSLGYHLGPSGARLGERFAFCMEYEWLLETLGVRPERSLFEAPSFRSAARWLATLSGEDGLKGHVLVYQHQPRAGQCARINEAAERRERSMIGESRYVEERARLRAQGLQGDAEQQALDRWEKDTIREAMVALDDELALRNALADWLGATLLTARFGESGTRLELRLAISVLP